MKPGFAIKTPDEISSANIFIESSNSLISSSENSTSCSILSNLRDNSPANKSKENSPQNQSSKDDSLTGRTRRRRSALTT